MSDQDFFFDEEDTAPEPKSGQDTGATKPSANRSQKPAPEARKSEPKPAPRAATPRTTASAGAPAFFEQSVSMTIAVLMTVIGVLIGVIVGFLVAPDSASVTSSTSTTPAATDSGTTAPELSEDELSSGALPEGHPDISSMGATGTAETPSE